MPIYKKEIESGFALFLQYRGVHNDGLFTLRYGDKDVSVFYEGTDEDDNLLDLNDPNYEEFNTIVFKDKDDNYFEVNYLNMPDEIYHKGKLIFKKENGTLKEAKNDT